MQENKDHYVALDGISIPLDRIHIQQRGYPTEIWGVVLLKDYPFFFRQSRSNGIMPQSGIDIHGHEFSSVLTLRPTKWFSHAPYKPLNFKTPIFTDPVTDEDREFVLNALHIPAGKIAEAKAGGELYRQILAQREGKFNQVREIYYGKPLLGDAIRMACGEKFKDYPTLFSRPESRPVGIPESTSE